MQKQISKTDKNIYLPEEICSFLGKDIYIGISLKKKRIVLFSRKKYENINIDNLIFPSVISENGCLVLPFNICRYLEWDFSRPLKVYEKFDCVVIEPDKKTPKGVFNR